MWFARAAGAMLAVALAGGPSPLVAPGAAWEEVAGRLGFGEGPAWHPDGYLLFEDVTNNRTLKLDAAGGVSVLREGTDSQRENLALDREAVYRVDPDGAL